MGRRLIITSPADKKIPAISTVSFAVSVVANGVFMFSILSAQVFFHLARQRDVDLIISKPVVIPEVGFLKLNFDAIITRLFLLIRS